MTDVGDIEIIDVNDESTFSRLPPCADARFDHRSCDYWEDDIDGSKASRPAWWRAGPPAPRAERRPPASTNPFAPPPRAADDFNPFAPGAEDGPHGSLGEGNATATPPPNPFAPPPDPEPSTSATAPRKLRLLSRGRAVFGSYAKILVTGGEAAVYAQFGPLSAYPRAQHIRELYPKLPQAPLPAVITCIATTAEARGQGLARRLIAEICEDLSERGFSAVEAYPDLTLVADEASAADPDFWQGCGFTTAADDERYPVMRRRLD